MKIKLLARVITYDKNKGKILLVKNRGMSFWYAPGGGWEYENENILECAKREVHEETGLLVDIKKMLYVQGILGSGTLSLFAQKRKKKTSEDLS